MSFDNQNIWIIGASSGIGKELAIQLDALGAKLILTARNKDKLNELNKQLNNKHSVEALDVSNHSDVKKVSKHIIKNHDSVDRIIFLPALYKPDSIENMNLKFMSDLVDVNLKSVFYITNEALKIFNKQKFGQIAICGSVAGYTGLANGQPYSATKAAIINFAESLYLESPKYIDVKLISPGFVKTPMTDKNKFKMPMIVSPQKAAKFIIDGLNKNKFEIHFPKTFTFLLKIVSILPYTIKFYVTKNFR
ncbi:MAG: short-chain dehydrogenase [Alphaproteobacteria bacterium CG11_big_fil_rev_8_21_14_0_20_39_49]|nr:MAG: short-chain dehydrogenase [Alphaproteobacteria bacterium CG11_big_fil_rev_8_21_14_0_20_39_49]